MGERAWSRGAGGPPPTILIVGGGISGLVAAAMFARAGANVTLIEARPRIGDEGGIGMAIMANAMPALDAIGVARACVAAGMPGDHIELRHLDGSLALAQPSARNGGPEWPGVTGIGRSTFHALLAGAAEAAGARLLAGTTFSGIAPAEDHIDVVLTNGEQQRFDLLIGADGVNSAVRREIFPEAPRPEQTGQSVWRALVDRPAALTHLQLVQGQGARQVGFTPMDQEAGYLYLVDRNEERHPDHLLPAIFREKLAGFGGFVAELIDQVRDPARVNVRPLDYLLVPGDWYRGAVVLIGDAAHAGPPTLAQGAAMGIEDAVALARSFAEHGSLDSALRGWMDRRRARVRLIIETSIAFARAAVDPAFPVDRAAMLGAVGRMLAEPF